MRTEKTFINWIDFTPLWTPSDDGNKIKRTLDFCSLQLEVSYSATKTSIHVQLFYRVIFTPIYCSAAEFLPVKGRMIFILAEGSVN